MPGSESRPAIRECEALFLDSIALAKRTIYIESQYFTNDKLADALAARLREPDGPEVIVISPKECHGWLEKTTMGTFRDGAFRQLIAADEHKRLRLVYPAASRSRDVPTFVHSKVMIVDDVLARIGSANFSHRSMGMDTECDLAVDAGGDPDARAGIRRMRDRLLAEHLGLSVGCRRTRDRARRIDRRVRRYARRAPTTHSSGSTCQNRPHRRRRCFGLPPIRTSPRRSAPRSNHWSRRSTRRAGAVRFASGFCPPLSSRPRPPSRGGLPIPSTRLPARRHLFGSGWSSLCWPASCWCRWNCWRSSRACVSAHFAAVSWRSSDRLPRPSSAMLPAGRLARTGSRAGSAGDRTDPSGNWAREASVGVVVLRLASVASAGSIHLLCGAGRVPFATYLAGTVIGLAPAVAALSWTGRPASAHASESIGVERIDHHRRSRARCSRWHRGCERFF